jgi:glycosyltransferase involved in cell wall biosynthesis
MLKDEISVAIITKNEANVLPKLLKSLAGITDIVILDTGSTDKTVEIAKQAGCRVFEVGDKFKIKATQQNYNDWVEKFGYKPSFKIDQGYFHFSNARNYAASLAENDWVFQPDADEIVEWNLEKVKEIIQNEDHLEYRFCYQYEPNGVCRKSKLRWTKWVHEIHENIPGQTPKPPKFVDFIYHHHYQEPKLERGNYLPGLELSVLENPRDDRNVYYLAREYFYRQEYAKAIKMFEVAVEINNWPPEKGQALIFKAQCHAALGEDEKAIQCFYQSIAVHNIRREPFWELGNFYKAKGEWNKAITYHLAATGVPFQAQGYLNSKELYSWKVEDSLAFLYGKIGDYKKSKEHWLKALKFNPPKEVLLGFNYFYKDWQPKVSIVVPMIRKAGFERLVRSLEEKSLYSNYEIIEKADLEDSAIKKFNEGVKEATGDLIVFIADDTEVEEGWLIHALVCFKERFRDKGLVILNDGYWEGRMAHHFLCSKNIAEELDGEIWHSGYHHYGADNELYYRLKKKNLLEYCAQAKIIHHHNATQTMGTKAAPDDKFYQRARSFQKQDQELLDKRAEELDFGPIQKVYFYPDKKQE